MEELGSFAQSGAPSKLPEHLHMPQPTRLGEDC